MPFARKFTLIKAGELEVECSVIGAEVSILVLLPLTRLALFVPLISPILADDVRLGGGGVDASSSSSVLSTFALIDRVLTLDSRVCRVLSSLRPFVDALSFVILDDSRDSKLPRDVRVGVGGAASSSSSVALEFAFIKVGGWEVR